MWSPEPVINQRFPNGRMRCDGPREQSLSFSLLFERAAKNTRPFRRTRTQYDEDRRVVMIVA
jgi:hypothetical protein